MTDTSEPEAAAPPAAAPSEAAPPAAPPRAEWRPIGALRPRIAYPLALLSGLLYFLGFPGMEIWPLSFIALVPLMVALRGQPVRRAAGLGWLAGFTMTMTGFYWLLPMLQVFSGFPIPVCVLFMAILCAYQGGRIALCGWLYGRAEPRGWPAPLVFALAFAASELLFPLLFPWYFSASVHRVAPLVQVAELGGPILVGLVLVAANTAIAEPIIAWRERRRPSWPLVAACALAPALAAAFGVWRISVIDARVAAAEPLKVGIVQPNLALFERTNAVQLNQRLTRELAAEGAELVVWSEAAVPSFWPEDTYQRDIPAGLTRTLGVPTIVGTVLRRPDGGDPSAVRFYNTALMADLGGEIRGRYDKHYLLMFGEYLPLGEALPVLYRWSPNSGRFTPGKTIDSLPFRDYRIGALICYEDILPGFVNDLVRHGDPHLLVNLTNDAWFGDSTEPWIHLALSEMRAVEHRRFMVRATNSGVSAIIDPVGRVLAHSGTFATEKLAGEVRFMSGSTVYRVVGDIPWWIAAAVIALMGVFTRPRRSPR
jgi:apolipoprotein N-acyltransferase